MSNFIAVLAVESRVVRSKLWDTADEVAFLKEFFELRILCLDLLMRRPCKALILKRLSIVCKKGLEFETLMSSFKEDSGGEFTSSENATYFTGRTLFGLDSLGEIAAFLNYEIYSTESYEGFR